MATKKLLFLFGDEGWRWASLLFVSNCLKMLRRRVHKFSVSVHENNSYSFICYQSQRTWSIFSSSADET